jgi:hypothetical protein
VPSLFKRKDADAADSVAEDTEPVEESAPKAGAKAYTAAKGRPTPKRKEAQRRTAEPPPTDRKEAARRLRDRQRTERVEARQKMMAGDEKYLPARDKGPERALTRDIVDSRRNVAGYFLLVALVILLGSSGVMPPIIQLGAQLLWVVVFVVVIIDSVLLARRVRKLVKERHPKSTVKFGSLYWYAIMRSIAFRRMRMPAPQKKIGEQV